MEGQRVEKSKGGKKLPWIITGTVVGVLAVAYIGVCAWAASRDAILPNVSVAGIDVSNLSVEQAGNTIEAAVRQGRDDITLTLAYEDIQESLDFSLLEVDAARSAQDAWDVGHGTFFTAGPQLLGHMMGISSQVPIALPENEPAQADLLQRMEQAVGAATTDHGYQVEEDRLVMTKGAPVITINWEEARESVAQNLQRALQDRFTNGVPVDSAITWHASQSSDTQEPDFEAIRRAVYTEPVDASLNLDTMEITDHTVGLDFDVQDLRTAYQNAKSGETFSIPLTVTRPKVTKEDLGGQLFQDLLGEGTTRVSGSANRKHNVKLAAEACNNKILLPGEEFSYNNTTGSRTVEKGYKEAPIYAGSKSDTGVGGGVCQPSSTIYFAVLHTNLEIVERHNHGFNTGYVEEGMDATVFFGVQDFRFKNNTDYPIKIVTNSYDSNGNRYLNVKIYGTNPEGIYAVPRSDKYNRVSPTTVYQPDPSVPQGTLVLDREQYAYTGISAHTYRDIYNKDGKLLETQDMGTSKYNMRPNTYYYNPADGDPSTWVNGKPGGATTPPDPGTTTPTDPGTTTPGDPGTPPPTDPGSNPGAGDSDPVTPPPSDSGINPIDPNAAAG